MIIVNVKDVKEVESTDEIVAKDTGKVIRQLLIDHNVTGGLGVVMVHFSPGARLNLHTHSGEQILFVTEGKGIVATEKEEYIVTPGAVIYIPPGEAHWHGATSDTPFSHIALYKGETKLVSSH